MQRIIGNAWSRKLSMIRAIERELGMPENDELNLPGLLQAGEKTVRRLLQLMRTVEKRPCFVPPSPETYWAKVDRVKMRLKSPINAKWPSMNEMLYDLEKHLHLDHSKIGCGFDCSLAGLLGLSRDTMTDLLVGFESHGIGDGVPLMKFWVVDE